MAAIRRNIPDDLEREMLDLLKKCKNERETRRVQVILLLAKHRWDNAQIAQATGYAQTTVRDIQTRFFRDGKSSLLSCELPKERNQYLKREQEREFLSAFAQSALEGELVRVSDIQLAFENKVGKKVAHSTVYELLKRNGWRKITPRPKNPKSDAQERERFKKTSEITTQITPESQSQWMPTEGDVPG